MLTAMVDVSRVPAYEQTACDALDLDEVGLNNSAVARNLRARDKTGVKVIKQVLGSKRTFS